ncbi:MAG: hypothetical protein BA871_02955 [Desulfuromonadales bacterium C00003096]|jgi:hypothetical protein|nr:MAG: hypothetical protein BA871_02955 [Desulfuromonadales bacterium C00003096]
MSKKDCVAWLYRELPELVRSRVLDEGVAEGLRDHYGPAPGRRRSLGLVICAALGALLVGLGIILLLAHNWADLSRLQRTLLSFAPLLMGQLLAGWTWLRRRSSRAWCEGAAISLLVAIGASIALVGQTYHISGDLPRFVLVWMLLAVPLIYFFDAVLPALLYWLGVTWWCFLGAWDGLPVMFFWLLVALPMPFWWRLVADKKRTLAAAWLSWGLALCLAIGLGVSTHDSLERIWAPLYLAFFAVCFLASDQWQASAAIRRPFRLLGSWGTVGIILVMTFKDVWRELLWHPLSEASWSGWPEYLLLGVLLLLAIGLLVRRMIAGQWLDSLFGLAAPGLTMAILASPQLLPIGAALLLANLYVLVLGGAMLREGLHSGLLPRINAGLGILSALIAVRFFDSQLPFTVRGVLFILIGLAFLAVNLLVKRREVRA